MDHTPSMIAGVIEDLVLLLRQSLVSSLDIDTRSVYKVISGRIHIESVVPVIFDA